MAGAEEGQAQVSDYLKRRERERELERIRGRRRNGNGNGAIKVGPPPVPPKAEHRSRVLGTLARAELEWGGVSDVKLSHPWQRAAVKRLEREGLALVFAAPKGTRTMGAGGRSHRPVVARITQAGIAEWKRLPESREGRADYIRRNYRLEQTARGWRASSPIGTLEHADRERVVREAGARWGHFNFADEARAFDEVFR